MKRSQWNENDIEELLRNLPEIKDKRNQQEVYQNIEFRVGKSRRKNWIPLIAAVAALLVLSVLAPSYMRERKDTAIEPKRYDRNATQSSSQTGKADSLQSSGADKESTSNRDHEIAKMEEPQKATEEQLAQKRDSPAETNKLVTVKKGAVLSANSILSADLKSQTVVTVGVPDTQVNYIVPVSYLSDEGGEAGFIDQLSNVMSLLREGSLGLAEYFPLAVKMTVGSNEQTINIDIPENSQLLLEDMVFFNVLQETFKYQDIDKVTFSSKGKQGAEFSHMGFLKELKINHTGKKPYLIYQIKEDSRKLLVPSLSEAPTIDVALQGMKNAGGDSTILPSIPSDLEWKRLLKQGNQIIFELAEGTKLQNNDDYFMALEAILFTAKDFGYKNVKFNNANIDAIGPYNLKESLPVPAAPNRIN